jgi:hypothetical protein
MQERFSGLVLSLLEWIAIIAMRASPLHGWLGCQKNLLTVEDAGIRTI